MICSECNLNPATVHITKIVNNQKKEMHICTECAKKLESMGGFKLINDSEFFMPLFTFSEEPKTTSKVCPVCGIRLSDFNSTGYLGCPACYNEFSQELLPVIKRVQGSVKHIGKTPSGSGFSQEREYERLTAELKKAVDDERYEDAAAIRDKLKKIR